MLHRVMCCARGPGPGAACIVQTLQCSTTVLNLKFSVFSFTALFTHRTSTSTTLPPSTFISRAHPTAARVTSVVPAPPLQRLSRRGRANTPKLAPLLQIPRLGSQVASAHAAAVGREVEGFDEPPLAHVLACTVRDTVTGLTPQ